MIVALLVGFELLIILFLGIFARTNSTSSIINNYNPLFNNCLFLLLAFTLISTPFRKFSLFTLSSILLIVAVAAQTYFLFGTFWDSCFLGFSSTFTIDTALIIRSLYASLLVLITALDFIGLFPYWQVYLIMASILTIGSSLCSSILIRGMNIFDGGGGLLVFFYSGISSFMIWAILIRKVDVSKLAFKHSYVNQTLALIGVILAFINWPKFNAAGAIVSFINANTNSVTLYSLQNSAISNTYLALSASIAFTFMFAQKDSEDKLHLNIFIECFINGGLAISSFQDIALNPTACIIIASLATIITLLIHKKLLTKEDSTGSSSFKKIMLNYGKMIYRLVFPFLGIIITSIVVATRSGTSPQLLSDNYSRTAGLQIVGLMVVLIFAVIFGAITAYTIKIFITSKQGSKQEIQKLSQIYTKLKQYYLKNKLQIKDQIYFDDVTQQNYPIYYDIFQNINQLDKQNKSELIQFNNTLKQSLLGESSNPLRQIQKNIQNNPPPTQPQKMNIINHFTKNTQDNPHRQIEVSAMKAQLRIEPEKSEELSAYRKLELDSNEEQIGRQIQQKHNEIAPSSHRSSEGMISFGNQMLVTRPNLKDQQDFNSSGGQHSRRQNLGASHVKIHLTSSKVQSNEDV